jgi:hypothetical protein
LSDGLGRIAWDTLFARPKTSRKVGNKATYDTFGVVDHHIVMDSVREALTDKAFGSFHKFSLRQWGVGNVVAVQLVRLECTSLSDVKAVNSQEYETLGGATFDERNGIHGGKERHAPNCPISIFCAESFDSHAA